MGMFAIIVVMMGICLFIVLAIGLVLEWRGLLKDAVRKHKKRRRI